MKKNYTNSIWYNQSGMNYSIQKLLSEKLFLIFFTPCDIKLRLLTIHVDNFESTKDGIEPQ
jgi:hypothetical protein